MPLSLLVLLAVFAEIATFILVGQAIGVAATLALTLAGMIAGAALLRRQGVTTLTRIRNDIAANRLPTRSLADGAVTAVAGLLLILPGFLTDLLGLLLFIPAVRGALWRRLGRRLQVRTVATAPLRPARPAVVELEPSEYSAAPRADTPWRRPENGDTP